MYRCLQKAVYTCDSFVFECLRESDLEPIRIWRNDQIDILRQMEPVSAEAQHSYFQTKIFPSFTQGQPEQILLRISEAGKLLGYGGLTHIDWKKKSGEISFLLDTAILETGERFENIYLTFVKELSEIAFRELHFELISAEVYIFREGMIQLLEKAGFVKSGLLQDRIFKRGKKWDALQYELRNINREV